MGNFQKKIQLQSESRKAAALRCGLLLVAVAAFYVLLYLHGITCPIKWFTGISCAGCGMTRAWISVLQGKISRAFYFHPLFWILPAAAAVWLAHVGRLIPDKVWKWLSRITLAIFLTVYVVRMFSGSEIVVFEPWQSVPVRLVREIINTICIPS